MKAPSKNISASLRGQTQGAGKPEEAQVAQQRQGGPTMTVPGEGLVQAPPGVRGQTGGREARQADKFVEPMKRYGGG